MTIFGVIRHQNYVSTRQLTKNLSERLCRTIIDLSPTISFVTLNEKDKNKTRKDKTSNLGNIPLFPRDLANFSASSLTHVV